MNNMQTAALLDEELESLLKEWERFKRDDVGKAASLTYRKSFNKCVELIESLPSQHGIFSEVPALLGLLQFGLLARKKFDLGRQAGAMRRFIHEAESVRLQMTELGLRTYTPPSFAASRAMPRFDASVVNISTGKSLASRKTTAARKPKAIDAQRAAATPNHQLPVPATYESRYLVAEAPSIVKVNSRFTVKARIDVQPGANGASATMEQMNIPEAGLTVTLRAVLPDDGHLQLEGADSREILVLPGVKSDPVAFAFKTLKNGVAKLTLRAYVEQAFRGELTLEMEVSSQGAGDLQEVTAEVVAKQPPSRDATLEIEYQAASSTYRFTLSGSREIGRFRFDHPLKSDPNQFAPDIMAQLNSAAKNRTGQSTTAVEKLLIGIGTDLWNKLLPMQLQQKLAAHWGDIERLALLSDDDPLPWELLYCPDKNAFISDHWSINRWFYGDAAPEQVGKGPASYVLPVPAPDTARGEIDSARALYPAAEVWATVDQLIEGLDKAAMGLLHIAAHNRINYINPSASAVKLDSDFSQSILASYKKSSLKKRPLVFLNACSSAAGGMQWVGSASWASRFLNAGAGAFIGSMWEIRDTSASGFSDAFYKHTHQGSNLGDAFGYARRSLGVGDPTRFAYTFFGDPDAILFIGEQPNGA